MICVASARHKMVCVSKMRFCATQRAPRRVDKAENSPRLKTYSSPVDFLGRGLANLRSRSRVEIPLGVDLAKDPAAWI